MKISARSVLMAGVTTLTVTAVAAAPSVQPLPAPKSELAVQLAAAVQPPDEPGPHLLQILLTDPARLLGPAVPFGTLPPTPAPIQFAIAPNLADTIDGIYIAVEPWVEYGALVATDLLGWVPWVGWLSGQIMVFYRFGEGMVASGVFNFTDWLRGDEGAIPNLVDFGLDVGRAFIWLGIDEWNYFLPPLPPLPIPRPPRPPAEGPFLALDSLLSPTETSGAGTETPIGGFLGLIDRILGNPLGVDSADLLGFQSQSSTDLEETSEVSSVPSIVKDSLNGLRNTVDTEADAQDATAGPLAEVTNAVRNVRSDIRDSLGGETRTTGGNGVVRAQGEVRGAVTKAVSDVTDAVRAGTPSKAAESATNASTAVAKSFGDTAKKVVNDGRQAAKDARDAAKNRSATDGDDE